MMILPEHLRGNVVGQASYLMSVSPADAKEHLGEVAEQVVNCFPESISPQVEEVVQAALLLPAGHATYVLYGLHRAALGIEVTGEEDTHIAVAAIGVLGELVVRELVAAV